jgi:hypothetical protein
MYFTFKNMNPIFLIKLKWTMSYVTTLVLGSWPRQNTERCKLGMQPENHIYIPKSVGECEGMNPQIFKWILILGIVVPMDFSENDLKSQNSLYWNFPYTIGNLLRHKCLKWSCIIHLNIYNINYGWKKVETQSVNLIFDHYKSKIPLNYMCARGMSHIVEKLSTKATIFF